MEASMTRNFARPRPTVSAAAIGLGVLLSANALLGQTAVTAPKNKYSVQDDVQLGRQAAQEVERQLPMLNDGTVEEFVDSLGAHLADSIPREFDHPEFRYTFTVVNVREINAF